MGYTGICRSCGEPSEGNCNLCAQDEFVNIKDYINLLKSKLSEEWDDNKINYIVKELKKIIEEYENDK